MIGLNIFLVLGVIANMLCYAESKEQETSSKKKECVELGLLPAVQIYGEEPTKYSLRDHMAKYHVPSVSISVINDGRVEWSQGYGVKEMGDERDVIETTLYQAASISKPVAAFGALLLVQDGKLDLGDAINVKLASWKVPQNHFTQQQSICLRHLLNHTGGFGVAGFDGYLSTERIPTLTEILDGTEPAKNYPIRVELLPGSKMAYSGGGYTVLQQLMEDVADQPFADYMSEHVLLPIGMLNSTFCCPLPNEKREEAALGHSDTKSPLAGGWNDYPQSAAAGLWTTSLDLAKFIIVTQKALLNSSDSCLQKAIAEEMVKTKDTAYGLGVFVRGIGDNLEMSHTGHNNGYLSKFVSFPYLGKGAVIMMNTDNCDSFGFMDEILRAIAEAYAWPSYCPVVKQVSKMELNELSLFVGRYALSDDDNEVNDLIVSEVDGFLYAKLGTASILQKLFPLSQGRFFLQDPGNELIFKGIITSFITLYVSIICVPK